MAKKPNWESAIDSIVKRYQAQVEPELIGYFTKAKIQYPPQAISLLAFKKEQRIELWAKDKSNAWKFIHQYPLTAYSGHLGPKLREFDKQIPEGIYQLTHFNPFSSMHLSIKINYPNEFDKLKGSKDGRQHLGDDIYIHGKNSSVGCLAIGNRNIDQLFILARRVGLKNTKLIISPHDLRLQKYQRHQNPQPKWLPELYQHIKQALQPYRTSPLLAKASTKAFTS